MSCVRRAIVNIDTVAAPVKGDLISVFRRDAGQFLVGTIEVGRIIDRHLIAGDIVVIVSVDGQGITIQFILIKVGAFLHKGQFRRIRQCHFVDTAVLLFDLRVCPEEPGMVSGVIASGEVEVHVPVRQGEVCVALAVGTIVLRNRWDVFVDDDPFIAQSGINRRGFKGRNRKGSGVLFPGAFRADFVLDLIRVTRRVHEADQLAVHVELRDTGGDGFRSDVSGVVFDLHLIGGGVRVHVGIVVLLPVRSAVEAVGSDAGIVIGGIDSVVHFVFQRAFGNIDAVDSRSHVIEHGNVDRRGRRYIARVVDGIDVEDAAFGHLLVFAEGPLARELDVREAVGPHAGGVIGRMCMERVRLVRPGRRDARDVRRRRLDLVDILDGLRPEVQNVAVVVSYLDIYSAVFFKSLGIRCLPVVRVGIGAERICFTGKARAGVCRTIDR